MNQINHKEIANIMKGLLTPAMTESERFLHKEICLRLADYFEREGSISKTSFGTVKEYPSFSRKQFLKWCGFR